MYVVLNFPPPINEVSENITFDSPPTILDEHPPVILFDEPPPIIEFDVSTLFKVKSVTDNTGPTCHKDIDLGPLNGVIHFSYIDMIEPLAKYVNYSIDKVDEHKIKATAIEDSKIIRSKDKVYGTIFELQGDVASPFQFYLTDSSSKFVSGVVYFNSVPNYDSLKPSLVYLKEDLMKMINTFKWKN